MPRSTLNRLRPLVARLGQLVRPPRPDEALQLKTPTLPADLAAWIQAREAATSDLRPGDQRRIDWADPAHPHRTPLALVYLHYWEDLTLEHAAEQLGMRVGTARTHFDRAKRKLRAALANEQGGKR